MALTAKVHIRTALRNGKTILQNAYSSSPFKLADITEDRSRNELKLMLMSSSPGMLDADDYSFDIDVAKGCHLKVQTQSYQRLFQMKTGAVQSMMVAVAEGGSFTFLPHPAVPHKGSIFTSRNKIFLEDNCTLVWGEVISCGRHLNDEVFQFSSYHAITEIFLEGKLVVKENLLLKPANMQLNAIGHLEGFTHQATLLYINESAVIESLLSLLDSDLQVAKDICFGISTLPVNGLVVRILGRSAEQLFVLLNRLSALMVQPHKTESIKQAAYV